MIILTGFIGHNSNGKTAILSALIKLLGEKTSDRIIERSDFYMCGTAYNYAKEESSFNKKVITD